MFDSRFSALKVDGQRAYKLAIEGKDFELKARPIFIPEIELVDYSFPDFNIKLKCSGGTYVRSIARDIGERLGTICTVTHIKRTEHHGMRDTFDYTSDFTWNDLKQFIKQV